MQKLLAAFLFAALAFGCQKSDPTKSAEAKPAEHKADAVASLTVDEVDTQLAAHQITPVDVNGDQLRKKMGTLPGAILLTDDEGYAPSELPADKTTKLVFYCHDEG